MARKRPTFEKLTLTLTKGGGIQFDTKYDAPSAARAATKAARQGWDVKVSKSWVGKREPKTLMSCKPSARKDVKAHAICSMTPAFKKRIRGR